MPHLLSLPLCHLAGSAACPPNNTSSLCLFVHAGYLYELLVTTRRLPKKLRERTAKHNEYGPHVMGERENNLKRPPAVYWNRVKSKKVRRRGHNRKWRLQLRVRQATGPRGDAKTNASLDVNVVMIVNKCRLLYIQRSQLRQIIIHQRAGD